MLARAISWFALPAALAAGIVLELAYPGEFTYALRDGGPALVAWIGLFGGVVALVVAAIVGKRGTFDDRGPLSAAVVASFVLPVAIFGFAHWDAAPSEASPLTPGVVRALERLPAGCGRLLRRLDELLACVRRAALRQRRAARPRRRHEEEPAVRAARRRKPLRQDRHARDPPTLRGRLHPRAQGALAPGRAARAAPDVRRPALRSLPPHEAPDRADVLPAGGWGWRTAPGEVRHAPPRARHRDARARAGRSEVDPPRRRPSGTDAGVDPPCALRRPGRGQTRRRAPRQGRSRALRDPGPAARAAPARAGRERHVGTDRHSGRGADRAGGGDRRRADDVAARLRPPRRCSGAEDHGRAMGGRPSGLARRASAPAGGHGRAQGEGADPSVRRPRSSRGVRTSSLPPPTRSRRKRVPSTRRRLS